MKQLRILAVALALIGTLAAQAQVKFGVKGGIEVLDFKSDFFNADNRMGWFIGPTVKIGLPLPGFAIDVAALYNQRESKIDLYETMNYAGAECLQVKALKTRQIAVPLNIRYGISLGSAEVFAYAGPQVAFRLGDESERISRSEEGDLAWRVKNSNFSVNGGVGFTVGPIQLTANYNVALGRTGDVTFGDAVDAAKNGLHGKYNSWQIGATWFF
jgi:hypothetical protein